MGRLDDKVCIITGAGNGIGRATFERFGREGATVVGAVSAPLRRPTPTSREGALINLTKSMAITC